MQEMQVRSLGQEDPLEKEMATHSIFLPGKFHGQRNLVSYSPWGCIESNMTKQLSGEHAMHSQMQMGPQKVPAGFFFLRDGVRSGV